MQFDAKRFLTRHAGWTALNVGGAILDYRGRIHEGESPGRAAVAAIATTAFYEMFPGVGMAMMAAGLISAGYPAYTAWQQQRNAYWQNLHRPNMGGRFRDNQQAMTMRQRAAQQIHEHHALARSVLGREARFFR